MRGRTNGGDDHKAPILRQALKDVQLAVQAAAVAQIEDLREHKRIESKRPHDVMVVLL